MADQSLQPPCSSLKQDMIADVPPLPLEDKLAADPPSLVEDYDVPLEECAKQPPGCGTLRCPGKPLFISHPDAALESRPDCYTVSTNPKGYGQPVQHPLFVTTSSDYGRYAPPPALVPKRKAFHSRFTKQQALGGMFEDMHFTTEKDPEHMYRPANDTATG